MQDLREFRSGADYDAQYGHLEKPEIQSLTQLAIERGGAVLDICCGTGLVTIPIAQETGLVMHGVDIADDMIAYAKDKSKTIPKVTFHHANALEFNLERTFDLAFMTGNAFQAFLTESTIGQLLANVHRHLKPDGLFVFNTRLLEHFDFSIDDKLNFKYEYCDASGTPVKYFSKKTRYDENQHILYSDMQRAYPDGRVVPSGIELKFTPIDQLYATFSNNGFDRVAQYANWNFAPFDPKGTAAVFVLKKQSS